VDERLSDLAAALGNVAGASAVRFGLRDDRGRVMDCLKIVAAGPGEYLGVSHALTNDVFQLNLAHSTDLLNWRFVAMLDVHASQGEIYRDKDGVFLVAYEHDQPGSNFVRLRRYKDRAALEKGKFATEVTIGRTLAPKAEGTPSFEYVRRDEIGLRFHYWRDTDVDRAAKGTLRGWQEWSAEPDATVNQAVEAFGVRGNIGSRARFTHRGQTFYLQEGQGAKNDWASWRVYLLRGDERNGKRDAVPVPIKTPGGATSFANPGIVLLLEPGKPPRFWVSLFLPTQGNPSGERGELVYIINAP
jgi:hypothetical protein